MKACRVSNIIAATCPSCGARTDALHRPIFKRGRFCHACCPVCAKGAAQQPPASARAPTAPKPMARGSQWIDLGYGPPRDSRGRLADPFYSDRGRREEMARTRGDRPWVPRRNWFGR
jgi:hypothetical protein